MKNGGSAFPVRNTWDDQRDAEPTDGMSLRDYFAAQALIGVIAARTTLSVNNISDDITQESIAEECYELADAMLAAREKPAEDA